LRCVELFGASRGRQRSCGCRTKVRNERQSSAGCRENLRPTGFSDLAIATLSMKVALEAWSAPSNRFSSRCAKESDDPEVVAAIVSKSGVVLRRPVESNGRVGTGGNLGGSSLPSNRQALIPSHPANNGTEWDS